MVAQSCRGGAAYHHLVEGPRWRGARRTGSEGRDVECHHYESGKGRRTVHLLDGAEEGTGRTRRAEMRRGVLVD
jgi:hypothetical protein